MITEKQFDDALKTLAPQLLGFAMKLTKNRADAEDLCQETYLKAFRYMHQYNEVDKFKSWITTIMHNSFVTNYRKEKRRRDLLAQAPPAICIKHQVESDHLVENQIFYGEVKKMIHELGDTCANTITMYAEGFSYEEISDRMQIPLGTVKSRINFARRKLQDKVAKLYPGQDVRRVA